LHDRFGQMITGSRQFVALVEHPAEAEAGVSRKRYPLPEWLRRALQIVLVEPLHLVEPTTNLKPNSHVRGCIDRGEPVAGPQGDPFRFDECLQAQGEVAGLRVIANPKNHTRKAARSARAEAPISGTSMSSAAIT
jgi:hypothetical protein